MYEMEGASSGLPHRTDQLPGQPGSAADRQGRAPALGSGLPAPPASPEFPPGPVPASGGECISTPRSWRGARGRKRFIETFLLSTKWRWLSAVECSYPPLCAQPFHRSPGQAPARPGDGTSLERGAVLRSSPGCEPGRVVRACDQRLRKLRSGHREKRWHARLGQTRTGQQSFPRWRWQWGWRLRPFPAAGRAGRPGRVVPRPRRQA